jgi:predicted metal-binding membrane protein
LGESVSICKKDRAPLALALLSLAAALVLASGAGELALGICSAGLDMFALAALGVAGAERQLALHWLLMLATMTPLLLVAPVRHLWLRSLADRRALLLGLFVASYLTVWMVAGLPLMLAAQAIKAASANALPWTLALALLWQMSPAKQACLNRCHRRPSLPAFGPAAARAVLAYGIGQGLWCLGACWPLMLAPLVLERGMIVVMAACTLFVMTERMEPPAPLAWRWRGTRTAARWVAARWGRGA